MFGAGAERYSHAFSSVYRVIWFNSEILGVAVFLVRLQTWTMAYPKKKIIEIAVTVFFFRPQFMMMMMMMMKGKWAKS